MAIIAYRYRCKLGLRPLHNYNIFRLGRNSTQTFHNLGAKRVFQRS